MTISTLKIGDAVQLWRAYVHNQRMIDAMSAMSTCGASFVITAYDMDEDQIGSVDIEASDHVAEQMAVVVTAQLHAVNDRIAGELRALGYQIDIPAPNEEDAELEDA
jgi:hypothetical protein